jgi:hypothetical protein
VPFAKGQWLSADLVALVPPAQIGACSRRAGCETGARPQIRDRLRRGIDGCKLATALWAARNS